MKFISKNANLRVVLRPGIPAEPLTGRQAVPGIHIKFENGIANIDNEEHCKMMLESDSYKCKDFVCADDVPADPYVRAQTEPEHDIMEIKHGTPGKSLNPKPKFTITPEMQMYLRRAAVEMAQEIAPKLAKDMLVEALAAKEAEKEAIENMGEQLAPNPIEECAPDTVATKAKKKSKTKTKRIK